MIGILQAQDGAGMTENLQVIGRMKMSLQFIIGSSGSGKSCYAYQLSLIHISLRVNHVLSFRTETVHGWITKETVSPSLLSMTVMYMKRMEQASTGTVRLQTYTICLYSKAWSSRRFG